MTTLRELESLRCAVCGKTNPQVLLGSTNTFGAPDLDTRPPEMMRSTIHYWVMECPDCRYAAPDISEKAPPDVPPLVACGEYQAIECKFQRHSYLLERLGEFSSAGWTSLHAAWIADDRQDDETARRCRARALELWKRGRLSGQKFMEDVDSEFALATDLLRRCGEFEQARQTCIEGLNEPRLTPAIEDILRLQLTLISRQDRRAHSMAEIPKRPRGGERVVLS